MDTPAGTEPTPPEPPHTTTSLRRAQWRRPPDADAGVGAGAARAVERGTATGAVKPGAATGANAAGGAGADAGAAIGAGPAAGAVKPGAVTGANAGAGAGAVKPGAAIGANAAAGAGAGAGAVEPGAGSGRGRIGRRPTIVAVALSAVTATVVAAAMHGGGSPSKATLVNGVVGPTRPAWPDAGTAPFTLGTVAPSTTRKPSPSTSAPRRPVTTAPRQSVTGSTVAPRTTGRSVVPDHPAAASPTATGDGLAGNWPLAQNAGSTSATDTLSAHPGVSTNVQWLAAFGIGYGWFDGSSSQISTQGSVLNTGAGSSFTVAAWVYMSDANAFHTAVSQDGSINSGFYLQYSHADNRWAFARVTSDSNGAPGIRALSSAPPVLDSWVHLVGVFDANGDQLRLYVNGVLEGTATDDTPFASNGSLAIGRALFNGVRTDWFPGAIRNVEVFRQALTANQIGSL
jgi:hypothetical protein